MEPAEKNPPKMTTQKVDFLSTEVPKGPEKATMPWWAMAHPYTLLCAGVRGAGKSTFVSSMLRKFKDAKCVHRVFLISPTYESNKHLWEGLVEKEDVYQEPTVASLDAVVHAVEEEVSQFRKWVTGKKIFERFKKHEDDYIEGRVDTIDKEIVSAALTSGILQVDKYPPYKTWGDIQRPLLTLIIDDCQNSQMFAASTKQKNGLSSLCIRSRHIGGLEYGGLSLCLLLQNYKSQQGVLSRSLRQNTTCMALWGYRDKGLSKDIYAEMASDLTEEEFHAAYEYATSGEKFNCLFVEFSPQLRLRRNFDEILFVSGEKLSAETDKKSSDGIHSDDKLYDVHPEKVRLGAGASKSGGSWAHKRAKAVAAENRKRFS